MSSIKVKSKGRNRKSKSSSSLPESCVQSIHFFQLIAQPPSFVSFPSSGYWDAKLRYAYSPQAQTVQQLSRLPFSSPRSAHPTRLDPLRPVRPKAPYPQSAANSVRVWFAHPPLPQRYKTIPQRPYSSSSASGLMSSLTRQTRTARSRGAGRSGTARIRRGGSVVGSAAMVRPGETVKRVMTEVSSAGKANDFALSSSLPVPEQATGCLPPSPCYLAVSKHLTR